MRRFLLYFAILVPVFMGNLDATVVSVAFPTMVSHFGTSLVVAGWILTIYTLVAVAAIPIASRLSDMGRRKSTFVACLVLFTIGSFLCSIAPNIGWLIFFRIIQASGGGGFVAAAVGLITDQLPERRMQWIGMVASVGNIGSFVGPNVGGILVEYLGWQSIFWVNVPIGLITLAICRYAVKADTASSSRFELDFWGISLLIGFVSTMMLSFTLAGQGYHIPGIVIAFMALASLAFLVMFLYRCKTSAAPVIDPELLSRRPFLAGNLYNFVFGTCAQVGIMSLMPLYATSVYGMSTLASGLMITPRSVGVITASVTASLFIMRWGYRRPILIGSLGLSAGLVLLALEPGVMVSSVFNISPAMMITLIAFLIGISSGIIIPASNNACIDLMPEKAASISGIRQVSRQTGGVLSVALSTLILQSSVNMGTGFTLVFGGFGLLLLVSLPLVFAMPANPGR